MSHQTAAEEDVHGLARLADVGSGKRVDKTACSLAVHATSVKKDGDDGGGRFDKMPTLIGNRFL
jgi:hypothetical protein